MIHLLWLSLLIPVAIHLVHRRKAEQVPFSTLRFLRMVDQRVARRHRLKELLLLALRLLLLAALVAALYRPMVRSATFKGGDVPTAAAIVLDNSYSMRAVAAGTTRFERARKAASEILQGLRRGDSACLVLLDVPGDVPPELTTNVAGLSGQLDAQECGWGAATAGGALKKALAALRDSNLPRKELYLVSDFQRRAWSGAAHELTDGLPADMPLFLVDVGGETPENLALEATEFGLNVQVAGAAATISCIL
ncbi:MAG: BatA domain-containing protein, partial [Candidatus Brocadiaceae bacterium]